MRSNFRVLALAPFFLAISLVLCACGAQSKSWPLHARPPGFWENGKATVQVVYTLNVFSINDKGEKEIREAEKLGTGIVVNPNGWILTNEHVVNNEKVPDGFSYLPGSDKYEVCEILAEKKKCETAEVVATDKNNDMAILRTKKRYSAFVTFVDDHTLQPGDVVYLWGNIYNLVPVAPIFGRFAKHIIKSENVDDLILPLLLIDISFGPGSSGGPVLDEAGRCVGQSRVFTKPETMGGGRSWAMSTPSTTILKFLNDHRVPYKVHR